ncbi:hypothetical protein [Streptosporangium sp. NPDC000396]|uniref:hypothetical protein n=1 Tax=Streptosporangium sp. NPDC000396 TaxID=3366185 RepID=UPI0036A1EED6
MIKVRNALAAGAMVASALIVPMTTPAQAADTGTVAGITSTTSVPTSVQKPCRLHKNPARCRARRGAGHGRGGGGGGGGQRQNITGTGSIYSGGLSPSGGGSGGIDY